MKLGLFSTLTGAGSRGLVLAVSRACAEGAVPDTTVAFLCVNRELGESDVTDESVALVRGEFDYPVVRTSAVRFLPGERKEARSALAHGDPGPMQAWRDAFNESFSGRLTATDMDLLLGDMWIWGPRLCGQRRGMNLHPALPTGPLGGIWYEALWDLIEVDARESGVMLHRVTADVDRGPVVSYTRYSLRAGRLEGLWATLPADSAHREALIRTQRALKRGATHPLFLALRAEGLAREVPLLIQTVRAVATGRIPLNDAAAEPFEGAVNGRSAQAAQGLDLTEEVEAMIRSAGSGAATDA